MAGCVSGFNGAPIGGGRKPSPQPRTKVLRYEYLSIVTLPLALTVTGNTGKGIGAAHECADKTHKL